MMEECGRDNPARRARHSALALQHRLQRLDYLVDVFLPALASFLWCRLLWLLTIVGAHRYEGLSNGAIQFARPTPLRTITFCIIWMAQRNLLWCCGGVSIFLVSVLLVLRWVGGRQHRWRARAMFAVLWFGLSALFLAMLADYLTCLIRPASS